MTKKLKKPVTRDLQDGDLSTLHNICIVAAERFTGNAKTLRLMAEQSTPTEGALFPTGAAAARLAEQFEHQAQQAKEFADLFSDAFPFTLILQPDLDEPEMLAG